MAFGKKKKDDEAPEGAAPDPAADAVPEAEAQAASDEEVAGSMFASEEPEEEDDAITAGLLAEEKAAASADPLSSDLLNMFQTTQIETEDVTVLLDLAGDVELDDQLEDLHTVAVALGCKLQDIEEMAAA